MERIPADSRSNPISNITNTQGAVLKLSLTRLVAAGVLSLSLCVLSLNAQAAPETEQPGKALEAATTGGPMPALPAEEAVATAVTHPTPGGVTVDGRYFPPPLTGKERWDKYVKDTFTGWPVYAASLGAALGDQASNTPEQWGRNWGGYAKRVGTQYASFAIQTSVYEGGSALFRNEGRYIPCQCQGAWRRAGYALQMTFLTYHDQKKVLDVPQFAAAYAAGMIPVLWYPQGYSVSAQGVQNGTYQLGFVAVVRQIQEFAPELKSVFRKFKP